MTPLKKRLTDLAAELSLLDRDLAEEMDRLRAELEEKNFGLEKEHQDELAELRADHKQEIDRLEEKLRESEQAAEFWDDVEAEKIGWLKTESPVKRILFEKLAERWDCLTNAELEDLEALLDGKLNFI